MAMRLDAGEYTRSEVFAIHPDNLVIDHGANARVEPHSDADVREMAESLLRNGQLQNAVGRRVDGAKVQLVLGYRRHAAVRLINAEPESFPADIRPKKLPFALRVVVHDMNDEEAFLKSVEENRVRKGHSVLDDVHNQRVLRETYNWDDDRIASTYGITVPYLQRLRKILQLPKEIQRAIPKGVLTVRSALDLADLSKEVRSSLFQRIKDESERLDADLAKARFEALPPEPPPTPTANNPPASGSETRVVAPDAAHETNGKPTAPPKQPKKKPTTKPQPKKAAKKAAKAITKEVTAAVRTEKGGVRARTLAEVREFFESLTGPAEPPLLREFAETVVGFVAGKTPPEDIEKWLRTVFPEK